jgi:hypothetical protein
MNTAPDLDLRRGAGPKPARRFRTSALADWLLLALSLAAIGRAAVLMLR